MNQEHPLANSGTPPSDGSARNPKGGLSSGADGTEMARVVAYLDSALAEWPENIYAKDLQSRFVFASRALAKRFGLEDQKSLLGKTDFDLFSVEHAQRAFDDEQGIIRTGRPLVNVEEKETYEDGTVTWVSTTKIPLHDAQGRIFGTFGISRDITAHKESELLLVHAQKELVEATRMAGLAEISSGVLHNIGNVLNSVTTSTNLLLEQIGRSRVPNLAKAVQLIEQHQGDLGAFFVSDPKGRQVPAYLGQLAHALLAERDAVIQELERLRKDVDHMREIVAMQQSYARSSPQLEELSPADLFEEAIRISEGSLNRHGILVRRVYEPVPSVWVVRHKVLQVLVNLIRNAKHALDDSGRNDKEMTVELHPMEGERVQFVVTDNGVGIPEENLTRIFTFGFTTRPHGHGFGLHSSVSAAREMGGTLKAESAGVGRGATFTLVLPSGRSGGV